MNRITLGTARAAVAAALAVCSLPLSPPVARAQDDAGPPPVVDTTQVAKTDRYANLYQGQFTPGQGFDIIRSARGTLNISVYGVFRYLNQLPADQTFTDHLGRVRTVKTRNDLNWHRTMAWFTGWFYDPRFRYNITFWSLPTTQQTLLFGNLRYLLSERMSFGVGIAPNLTNRSMQGSWPYWAASDRLLGEEFIRGGFASGFWVTGKLPRGLYYTGSVNTNISQLGVPAASDTRNMAFSGSVWWQRTGEFGPRGGFGDLEHHDKLATQIGLSACNSRESRYATAPESPLGTQIKLSDGVNPFEDGALANGVTVNTLTYQIASADAGAKYRGFSIQSEYSYRLLSDFSATGPLPVSSLRDQMLMAEAMHMVVPRRLGIYAATSYVWDDFQRHPWEVVGGADFYPYGNRQWRLNLHVIHIEKSPASSNFGFYQSGQTGTTISIGTDILL